MEAVKGDLDQEHFGLDQATWQRIADEADSIVHNGALVSTIIYVRAKGGFTELSSSGTLGISV